MATIKLGIAPIAWTNDDMPDLGKENTFEQCVSEMALAGFTGQPFAACHKRDAAVFEHALLLFPHRCCKVVLRTACRQQPTMMTLLFEAAAIQRQVADRRCRPQVVHRPYHMFLGSDFANGAQRQHALVDPMQMHDVGFLIFAQPGNVGAGVGNVDFKQVLLSEVQVQPDDQPFPQEMELQH